jgi:hypothetical protein
MTPKAQQMRPQAKAALEMPDRIRFFAIVGVYESGGSHGLQMRL